jgi:hypothetical protein
LGVARERERERERVWFAPRRIEAMQRDSSKSLMSHGDMKKVGEERKNPLVHWRNLIFEDAS